MDEPTNVQNPTVGPNQPQQTPVPPVDEQPPVGGPTDTPVVPPADAPVPPATPPVGETPDKPEEPTPGSTGGTV
ncbi:hypothetical protein A2210_03375 [Candidatus Woesebacteria bacterium RIFOXYA1_FULL_40_18]|uniref:Uncharacterized protein n=5 Tax=Candidatus Woeseibacteriota TaxID=1752722 RepID=A0A0G0SM22_9BACT|nr:MAG: hypothetical protein UT72_C0005G0003 [Candidatus Woesebacteria bacterium GW2011_GWB1_40_101]KKR63436.1 MAG: hypothetical protein UU03_C0004G0007 [Candidatus Woesebacteria bacterium GW2011_GWA1_40_45]OGM77206.1 MAG: hypothetical protein A2210_03375 [Candidatus Woesebacteria bacterium RIFOXYA1_FULL_40_18]OGM79872.1 MAG: hypothetical protein A2361_02160 [Candidatus Woesebacteria bacterium RIFOXYB1_FULL_40_26]OGM88200.1 MAG: hypothetical protein A2614_01190 [Candidatus Woesebacteria bacteri